MYVVVVSCCGVLCLPFKSDSTEGERRVVLIIIISKKGVTIYSFLMPLWVLTIIEQHPRCYRLSTYRALGQLLTTTVTTHMVTCARVLAVDTSYSSFTYHTVRTQQPSVCRNR